VRHAGEPAGIRGRTPGGRRLERGFGGRWSGLRRKGFAHLSVATLLLVLAAATVLAGCQMGPEAVEPTPPHEEAVRADVERRIEEGRAAAALQRLSGVQDKGVLEDDVHERLRNRAVSGLVAELEQAHGEREYRRALSRYRSLAALGETERAGDFTEERIRRSWAEWYREEEKNPVAAIHTALRLPDFDGTDPEILREYGRLAVENNHRFGVERIVAALEAAGESVPESMTEYLERLPDLEEMLAGTATIWVDEGVRIREGVGRRDQVIGSAFYIDKRGYLITNYHVIRGAVEPDKDGRTRVYVRPHEDPQERIPARVVGYDRVFDIALLKVAVEPEFVFSFSDLEYVSAGTDVYAMGSPGGLTSSITSGIVSATGRRFLPMGEVMQVDAALNPGSSGGPILTQSGDLLGVVFAGAPQFQGVNFAVPSEWIRLFLPRLYDDGQLKHPWLGVAVHERRNQLEVTYVLPGSPAAEAGLEVGDVLERISGEKVDSKADAQRLMLKSELEELVKVEISREGQELVRYAATTERPFRPVEEALERDVEEALFGPLFGMKVRELSSGIFRRNFVVERVYRSGPADEANISEQDPFTLRGFEIDTDRKIAILEMVIRQRRSGYAEQGLALANALDLDSFL